MSIRDFINVWTQEPQPRLWWHQPALQGEESKRFMLITSEIREVINGPWESATDAKRGAFLRGDLDAFVEGRRISVADDPYQKDKTAYLARVHPPEAEIWDIRSIDPKPGIRVLGCFVETDVFIALVWEFRDRLDGPNGPLWEAFIQRAEHAWRGLFQSFEPFSGGLISDYISSDFFLV